ncbi:DUF5597 domain-containing protein [Rathayibacter sp. VKM Ac-2856]|uniref:DUF5597 domain-containing protein n=1 Tax=unclassified Rathayibacter TaxID=2609250 RepID=UPI0015638712|nr:MULTISPECIES: DUF5597 domain-containing protein [unclassified Rathayibacter]NQX03426.1 DUF5597 domain-containing protein [Rathayibacter sp. VKM Ac-2858]NQX18594.1 DUF5597 domain-containing protein [Rathayibacter sp. VKM Ac-2856]
MTAPTPGAPVTDLPRLDRSARPVQLIVDGAPFLCLGGELHNSSPSDPRHMAAIWSTIGASGVSSIVAPIGWDQVEPVEGEFDFAVLDALLEGARSAGVRLVLIWFGAFKNALSTYAPTWVRADTTRFERSDRGPTPMRAPLTYEGSMPRPGLSVFSDELRRADRTAYTALMEHLARIDEAHTVIMMQVENEVGLLGASRDLSGAAQEAWLSPVPTALVEAVSAEPGGFHDDVVALFQRSRPDGSSWQERFGDDDPVADEVFMSWGYGSYLGTLAAAGKAVKALPAYANAWLGPQPGQDSPGQYPSGGPTARMRGVWRVAGPALDFVSPDIYVQNSEPVMREYSAPDNPLFIPEARVLAGDAFRAIGGFDALGYHVFGVDDVREGSQLYGAFRQLLALAPQILEAQRDDRIIGFALDAGTESLTAEIGGMTVVARSAPSMLATLLLDVGVRLPEPAPLPDENLPTAHAPSPADARAFGIVLQTGPLEYLAVGQQTMIDFSRDGVEVEIDSLRELRLEDGEWVEGRILNGDERLMILGAHGVTAVRVRLLEIPAA